MGKVARKIIKIVNPRDRKITFKKRYDGVMKKIHELGILCDQDTFLFVRDRVTQRVRMFSSSNERFIPHYATIKQEDRKGPSDMQRYYEKTKKSPIPDAPMPISSSDGSPHKRAVYKALLQQGLACHGILQNLLSLRFQ
jgi:hypothetical protein